MFDHDRLAAALAVQNGLVTAEALAPHQVKDGAPLSERLMTAGLITPRQRNLLEQLIRDAVGRHGSVERSLALLGPLPLFESAPAPDEERPAFAATLEVPARGAEGPDSQPTLTTPSPPAAAHWHAPTVADEPVLAPQDEHEVTSEHPGRYVVKREFGRGGMSVVYLAHDRHVGRDVALKQLLPRRGAGSDGPRHNPRFLREARVTGQLEHPGIVPVYEVGERPDGSQYYTQKLIRGRTLLQAIFAGKTLHKRLELLKHFVDLCQAMAYAHSRGVVHRDLKPENVMVGEFGETVVLDWGLAKVRGQPDEDVGKLEAHRVLQGTELGQTLQGSVMGTPSYMSPEQAAGKLELVDEISDVFGLGAILFEILTGRPPYEGTQVSDLLERTIRDDAPPARSIVKDAPPELCAIADRALQKKRERRYQSARELASEVLAWMSGARVAAYEYTSWELAKKFVARNRVTSAVAAAALVLLAVAAAWIWIDSRSAARNLLLARENLAFALIEKAHAAEREFRWSQAAALFAASRVQSDSPEARWGALLAGTRAVQPLLELQPGAGEALAALEIEHAGKPAIAVALEDGSVRAFDAATAAPLWKAQAHQGPASALAQVYGRILVSGGGDGSLRVLGEADGAAQGVSEGAGGEIPALAVSPDGALFAAGSLDGTLRLWKAGEPRPLAERQVMQKEGLGVSAVAFTPDGAQVAAAGEDGTARFYGLPALSPGLRIEGGGKALDALALAPDGRTLATGALDGSIRLFALPSGEPRGELRGHERPVEALVYTRDGALLASGGWDGTAVIWDAETGRALARLDPQEQGLNALAFSRDGARLLTAGRSGAVHVWGLQPRALLRHDADARAVVYLPGAGALATADEGGRVLVWSRRPEPKLLFALPPHDQQVRMLAASPDGRLLASGDGEGLIRIDDLQTRREVRTLRHGAAVNWVEFSPDGRTLGSASEDGTARLWDTGTGTELFRLAHDGKVRGLAFSPDGTRLATGAADKRVRVFDVQSGRELAHHDAHGNKVRIVRFSPDGKLVASGGSDHRLLLWAWTQPGAQPVSLGAHEGLIRSILFTADGATVATASADRTVRLWDVATRREVARFPERERELTAMALSPAQDELAVAGRDGRVELYPLPSPASAPPPAEQLAQLLQRYRLSLSGVSLVDLKAPLSSGPKQPATRRRRSLDKSRDE